MSWGTRSLRKSGHVSVSLMTRTEPSGSLLSPPPSGHTASTGTPRGILVTGNLACAWPHLSFPAASMILFGPCCLQCDPLCVLPPSDGCAWVSLLSDPKLSDSGRPRRGWLLKVGASWEGQPGVLPRPRGMADAWARGRSFCPLVGTFQPHTGEQEPEETLPGLPACGCARKLSSVRRCVLVSLGLRGVIAVPCP